ncbi:MAG TPA: carboxypeptidase regulatory-like domain-containing protein [Thermoanaerobaculia bacterium]
MAITIGLRSADESVLPIRTERQKRAGAPVVFDELTRGMYVVVAAGAGPLERAVAHVGVAAGDERTISIPIRARQVTGRFLHGGRPFDGTVLFESNNGEWTSPPAAVTNGVFAGSAWASGELRAVVSGGALRTSYMADFTLAADANAFTIDIPSGVIRGRVVDETGRPREALLSLSARQPDGTNRSVRTRSSADGRFEFSGVSNDAATLHVIAPGCLAVESQRVRSSNDVVVVATCNDVRQFTVVDDRGSPLGDAALLCFDAGRLVSRTMADEHGRAVLPMPAKGAVLVLLPAEGGISVVRDMESPTIRHTRGASSLEVRAMFDDGTPATGISFVMRMDGELLPFAAVPLKTDAAGMAQWNGLLPGHYELWPYERQAEAELIVESGTGHAPVSVDLKTGITRVTVRMTRN